MTRALTAILFGIFLSVSSAHAQDEPTPHAAQFSESHIDAARQHLSMLLRDGGMLSEVSPLASNILPTLRERVRATPFFASLSAERQQAMSNYLTNSGPIIQEEAIRGAPLLIDRFASRFAALFSEEELNSFTTFMQTEHGGSSFSKTVWVGGTGLPPGLTSDESLALELFFGTSGGRAFTSRSAELWPLMHELGYAATSAPNVRARLQRDLCEIAGPDCPTAWRTDL